MRKLYRKLLKNGWTLNEIDEMDIHFFFDLYAEQEDDNKVYIDQIRLF